MRCDYLDLPFRNWRVLLLDLVRISSDVSSLKAIHTEYERKSMSSMTSVRERRLAYGELGPRWTPIIAAAVIEVHLDGLIHFEHRTPTAKVQKLGAKILGRGRLQYPRNL
jgi:hypothetical protein